MAAGGVTGERVLVLGGGIAGLAAAWALSAPELGHRVTVVQPGWRLGGKGASGRRLDDAGAARIEEHGLHLWSGIYHHAFALLRACYAACGRPPGAVNATLEEALRPHPRVVLMEHFRGAHVPWPLDLPIDARAPGEPGAPVHAPWREQLAAARALLRLRPRGTLRAGLPLALGLVGPALTATLGAALGRSGSLRARWLAALRPGLDRVWSRRVRPRLDEHLLRRQWITLNFAYANAAGHAIDRVGERGFDVLDDQDYRAWLARFLVDDDGLTLASPLTRFLYDAQFAYQDGDLARPDLAAGAALRVLTRMAFGWRGCLLWRMHGGMGDVVFAPIYTALRARGVAFRFFQRAEALEPAADDRTIAAVRIAVQATVRGGPEAYVPLVDVGGLECWPATPRWDQLAEPADEARARAFERCDDAPIRRETLRRGDDFDAVVLAVPPAVLPRVAARLAEARPAWRSMLAGLRTVATQAVQWWTPRPLAPGDGLLASTYATTPLNTLADMGHLLPYERAADDRGVVYFCGPLAEPVPRDSIRAIAAEAARAAAIQRDTLTPGAPPPAPHAVYARANTAAVDRFTLTPAGATATRLAPDASGYEGLALAGDWTRNGINFGNIESAVRSGLLAAAAIDPRLSGVVRVE